MVRIGITSGVFDIFHYWHWLYLKRCKDLCDFLIVGVDCDELVKERKGKDRPFLDQSKREEIIQSLDFVDMTFIMESFDHFEEVLAVVKPAYLFKNEEYFTLNRKGEEHVGEIKLVPDVAPAVHTSDMIKVLKRKGFQIWT